MWGHLYQEVSVFYNFATQTFVPRSSSYHFRSIFYFPVHSQYATGLSFLNLAHYLFYFCRVSLTEKRVFWSDSTFSQTRSTTKFRFSISTFICFMTKGTIKYHEDMIHPSQTKCN